MKYCGMTNYSETCLHPQAGKTTEDMNNPALDQDNVQPLSKRNLEIFNAFKENLKRGIFPPVKVVHDEKYGFSVEAVKAIPTQTLIAEYVSDSDVQLCSFAWISYSSLILRTTLDWRNHNAGTEQ